MTTITTTTNFSYAVSTQALNDILKSLNNNHIFVTFNDFEDTLKNGTMVRIDRVAGEVIEGSATFNENGGIDYKIRIINTPMGKIIKELFNHEINLNYSLHMLGILDDNGGDEYELKSALLIQVIAHSEKNKDDKEIIIQYQK